MTPSQLLVNCVTKPNGISISLKISVLKKTRQPLISKTTNATTKAGINAVKALETPSGTCSGILMTQFLATHKRYNCTAITAMMIPVKIPTVPRRATPSPLIAQPLMTFSLALFTRTTLPPSNTNCGIDKKKANIANKAPEIGDIFKSSSSAMILVYS